MVADSRIILCRILGSDLPPRHHERQSIENVKFILENERVADDIERRWILNRIWNAGAEQELLDLLKQHNQLAHRIPFDREFYRQQFLDPSGLPSKFNPLRIMNTGPKNNSEVIAFEWIYRRKNLAAIGLNEARNAAIEWGIRDARWVLPLDGNTFIREDALLALRELVRMDPLAKYLVIPMVRFFSNSEVLDCNSKLEKTDEPQIGFRNDSLDRFDAELRYGNRPKAELLVRLGVPGPWHDWPRTRWEPISRMSALDHGRFVTGSWVARLGTGADPRVEASTTNRWGNRILSIAHYCDAIELSLVDLRCLTTMLHCYGRLIDQGVRHEALIDMAEAVLESTSAKHESNSDQNGQANFQKFAARIITFALAFRSSGDVRYAKVAAECARAWFFDSATRIDSKVHAAQNTSALVEYADIWGILDSLRILWAANAINASEQGRIADWLQQFRDNWMRSEAGKQAETARNGIAILHDLIVASISAYLGDQANSLRVLRQAPLRMHNHLEPFGAQISELTHERPLHNSLVSLQLWFNLAHFGRSTGLVDLWRCGEADHKSLAWALRFLCLNRSLLRDYRDAAEHFNQRIDLLLAAIPLDAVHREVLFDLPKSNQYAPSVEPGNAVPPLWFLLASDEMPSKKAVA